MTEDAVLAVYSHLDHATSQIRLLHLQPHLNDDGEITCSLSLCNLDDEKSRYEALSYEWGDSADTLHSIRLDGSKFAVRGNLWLALFHLRDNDSIRVLWIDALCINQANEGERNHQVLNQYVYILGLSLTKAGSPNGNNIPTCRSCCSLDRSICIKRSSLCDKYSKGSAACRVDLWPIRAVSILFHRSILGSVHSYRIR